MKDYAQENIVEYISLTRLYIAVIYMSYDFKFNVIVRFGGMVFVTKITNAILVFTFLIIRYQGEGGIRGSIKQVWLTSK